jgi:GNAT superfamily N-acetyltransferase
VFISTSSSWKLHTTVIAAKADKSVEQSYDISERLEKRAKDGNPLIHFEISRNPPKKFLDIFSPPSKPIARVGMRPEPASSESMDQHIHEWFDVELEKNVPVGILVYMWVDPSFRGLGMGLSLLNCVKDRCRLKGMKYLLIVHDDNGSGKLVRYYKQQGFKEIYNFVEKGMITKL